MIVFGKGEKTAGRRATEVRDLLQLMKALIEDVLNWYFLNGFVLHDKKNRRRSIRDWVFYDLLVFKSVCYSWGSEQTYLGLQPPIAMVDQMCDRREDIGVPSRYSLGSKEWESEFSSL